MLASFSNKFSGPKGMRWILFLLSLACYFLFCIPLQTKQIDPNSYANIDSFVANDLKIFWTVDFEKTIINGSVEIKLKSLLDKNNVVFLDTSDLLIQSITDTEKNLLEWRQEKQKHDLIYGTALAIQLKTPANKGQFITIIISYETSRNASALNWIPSSQTPSSEMPLMYSQCQPISCRSILPIQDTPQIKINFTAFVSIKKTQGKEFNVFLSAKQINKTIKNGYIIHTFQTQIEIPSYLIAIVVGLLETRQIGNRTSVIADPKIIKKATEELGNLERYLGEIESYLTPYEWEIYRIVVLPPSFPYGGMENPLLTFASPTMFPGDKSEVYIAIHEIIHSWIGNLVTSKTWEHFWLNEGFTKYLERHFFALMEGGPDYNEYYNFASFVGNLSMMIDINSKENHTFTSLHPNLTGEDPSDQQSNIPQEKGFQFLQTLKRTIDKYKINGNETIRQFLISQIKEFRKKSIGIEEMWDQLSKFLNSTLGSVTSRMIFNEINITKWFYSVGKPPTNQQFESKEIGKVISIAKSYIENQNEMPNEWNYLTRAHALLKIVFIGHFIEEKHRVNTTLLEKLEATYGFSRGENAHIRSLWFTLTILVGWKKNYQQIEAQLCNVGRLKYIGRIYRALNQTDYQTAVEIYLKCKKNYHNLAVRIIEKTLNLNQNRKTDL